MTWKVFWTAAGAIGLALLLALAAAINTTFLYRHPKSPDVRIVIDPRTGSPVVAAYADPKSGIKPLKPEPKVHVPESKFNFGKMDPGVSGRHEFVIENKGDAELLLGIGETTCKCTISGVSDNRIPPGKTAKMTMEWNTGRYNPQFNQSAFVRTNDAIHKELTFTVEGQVRALLLTEPNALDVPPIKPGGRGEGEVVIYSQTWKNFEIVNVNCALPGFQWSDEALAQPAEEIDAAVARRLKFTFDAPEARGGFNEKVRIDIRSPEDPDAQHHQYVDVTGKSMLRLAFYGPAIGEGGVVELGNITQGKGKQIKLLAKLRDQELDLGEAGVETSPPFLKAKLTASGEAKHGLYNLTIEIPDDIPPCQFNSNPIGRVQIKTSHPRVGTVVLPVTFAVVPRQSL